MNIYIVNKDILRFKIYNLISKCFDGHFEIYYRISKKDYIICQFGTFNNLVSIKPVKGMISMPTTEQKAILDPIVKRETQIAIYYHDKKQLFDGYLSYYNYIFTDNFMDDTKRENNRIAIEFFNKI